MRATSILTLAVCALFGGAVSAADATTVKISQSDLPAAVLNALVANGSKQFDALSQTTGADGKVTYAATVTKDGKTSVVTVAADGTVISVADAK